MKFNYEEKYKNIIWRQPTEAILFMVVFLRYFNIYAIYMISVESFTF